MKKTILILLASAVSMAPAAWGAAPIRALIIDGQNNHNWRTTTPVLKQILEDTGLFQVEIGRASCRERV